ncbi:MAG: hypothetical protein GX802_01405 [Clostridiales bacterium]|nr:hypothetical protein [Clostridiales bacterium]
MKKLLPLSSKRLIAFVCCALMIISVFTPGFTNTKDNSSLKSRILQRAELANLKPAGKLNKAITPGPMRTAPAVIDDIAHNSTKALQSYWLGDVSGDGTVNTGDATLILRYFVGYVSFNRAQVLLSDANQDGKTNSGDAVTILLIVVGKVNPAQIDLDLDDYVDYLVSYNDGIEEAELEVPLSEYVAENQSYTIPLFMLSYQNYRFLGWQSSVNNTIYQAGDSFVVTSNVTLTAKWSNVEGTYSITFLTDTDKVVTGMPENVPEIQAGQEFAIPANVPFREDGHPFLGWKSNINYNTFQSGSAFNMPEYDVILTAMWGDTPAHKCEVTIKLFDVINESNVGEIKKTLYQTTTFSSSNLDLPEGYKISDESQSLTVTVIQGGPTTVTVTLNVFECVTTEGVDFRVISTPKGVNNVRNGLDKNYILKNDITMGNSNFIPIGWKQGNDFDSFTGIFDGNGFIIENLLCDYYDSGSSVSNVGLFSSNEGTIKNLGVMTALGTDTSSWGIFGFRNVGAIAGRNEDNGIILNCQALGYIGVSETFDNGEQGGGGAGGITGSSSGLVSCSGFYGYLEGSFWIGGVVGKNFATVEYCWSAIGINSGYDAETAYYYSFRYIGGLIGGSGQGTVHDSYVGLIDIIKGDMAVGGIMGWCSKGSLDNIFLFDCGGGGIQYVTGPADIIIGYVPDGGMPSYSGLYEYENVEGNTLPEEFSEEVWDFGSTEEFNEFQYIPDLIKNRRFF